MSHGPSWWPTTRVLAVAPDDGAFIVLWASWVVLLALVTSVLLGWASGASILGVAGLVGIVTIAVQSSGARRTR